MNLPNANSRRETILASAWGTFTAYGFRRTSMQDIADAAGISRPALYLEFANKADIFRALAKTVFEQNIVEVTEIFKGDLPLEDKLLSVLVISFVEFYRKMEDTPHGEELLSIKTELASDIYLDWLGDIRLAIGKGISAGMDMEKLEVKAEGLGAEELSAIIVDTMHGTKHSNLDEADLRNRAKSVVLLVMAALSGKQSS